MLGRMLLSIAAMLALLPSPARAYWEYGHGTVAAIAMERVRPDTRRAVLDLLRQGELLETPTCPLATPEEASVWADCVRAMGDRFSYTAPWHYQNIDVCRPFDLDAPCRDGNCVSAQVDRNARLLADTKLPLRERVMALAFLIHFVGDLHQPMHAGDHRDLGGNRVAANYGLVGGRANLHGIWDGWLAERAISTPPGESAGLLQGVSAASIAKISAGTSEDWSREMWAKSRDLAYRSLLENPCGEPPASRPTLTESGVQALIPHVRENILAGGLRLARLLDDALGPQHKAPPARR